VIVLDLPVQAQPWARGLGLPLLADLPQAGTAPAQGNNLVLLNPRPGTTFHLTSDIDQAAQQLAVEAVAAQGLTQIKIYVDGSLLAAFAAGSPYKAWWPLTAGQHTFRAQALAPDGQIVTSPEVTIQVLAKTP